MNYYKWIVMPKEAKNHQPYIIVNDIYNSDGIRLPSWKLVEGEKIGNWDHNAYASYMHSGPHWDSLVQKSDLKIISEPLRIFMESSTLADEIQAMPLRLVGTNKLKDLTNYFLLHILNPVDCIDLDQTPHSVVEEDDEEIEFEGWPITLKRKDIGNRKLFRLRRNTGTVIIQEDLRKQVEDLGFTGFGFTDINVA